MDSSSIPTCLCHQTLTAGAGSINCLSAAAVPIKSLAVLELMVRSVSNTKWLERVVQPLPAQQATTSWIACA